MSWEYKGKLIETVEDAPEDALGFIYEVTHIPTGKKYLGRKQMIYSRKRKIGKRETKRLKEERKEAGESNWWTVPKTKVVKKESDWKEYYGSSEIIQELLKEYGADSFKREILEFGFSKKHLTYLETKYLFENNVLIDEVYANENILGKFFRNDIIDYI